MNKVAKAKTNFYYSYITVIILLILSILFSAQVHAEEKEVFVVDSPSLTVRSEPKANSVPLGYLQSGDRIAVFSSQFGWAKSYFNNQEAWVASQFLSRSEPAGTYSQQHRERISIMGNGVRIRTGPGLDFPAASVAYQDEIFTSISINNGWRKIELENGNHGWVASQLTTSTSKERKEEENIDKLPLEGHTIVLDAGHGGRDPGAIALDNTYEKNLTLETVQRTTELLKKAGATVILTREDDTGISLNNRIKLSNETFADAFVSFHYNSSLSSSMNGTHTFYYRDDNSRQLAESLQHSIAEHTPLVSNGTRKADFRVLKNNQNPSALIELGFLSNAEDLASIQTEDFQKKAARAVTDGLLAYFHNK